MSGTGGKFQKKRRGNKNPLRRRVLGEPTCVSSTSPSVNRKFEQRIRGSNFAQNINDFARQLVGIDDGQELEAGATGIRQLQAAAARGEIGIRAGEQPQIGA